MIDEKFVRLEKAQGIFFPHNSEDIYGNCPNCGYRMWHHFLGFAQIFDTGKVSLFKCRVCKKKFGFLMEGVDNDAEKRISNPADCMDLLVDWNERKRDEPESEGHS